MLDCGDIVEAEATRLPHQEAFGRAGYVRTGPVRKESIHFLIAGVAPVLVPS